MSFGTRARQRAVSLPSVRQRVDVAWLVEHFGMALLPVESTYFVRTYTSTVRAAAGSAAGSAIIGLFVGGIIVAIARGVKRWR